jgi:hypothetical protein
MPMPRLPATHHKNSATKKAFQVNIKSAATAPMWNAIMKNVVSFTIGSRKVLSRLKKFTSVSLLGGSCLWFVPVHLIQAYQRGSAGIVIVV